MTIREHRQAAANDKRAIPIRRVQFFTLRTHDLTAARRFYVELLGFSVLSEKAGEFVQFEIAGVPICVDLTPETRSHQPNQIGIEVDDLELTQQLLREKGFATEIGSVPGKKERWISIKDPDGHELIFIAGS